MLNKNLILILPLVLLLQIANAQIVSGNAFMQGNYVEVGIGPCGTYGTSIDAPAGYHPRGNGAYVNRLGFIADPNKDGWAVGTPNYCGDYFVPGTPEEGFGLQINGTNYNNNLLCSEASIPGAISDYKISGTNILTTWEGQIAGVHITSITKVPINDVFFITEVTLKNVSASTINNLYYMRNVDPDNEVTLPGGSYYTNNLIVAENPNTSSRALVSATGLSYGCYLGLGTKDCRARVSWGGFSNRNPADVWNGTGGLSQSGSSINDIAISIAFKISSLAPGESTTFKFAHVLAAADLERALDLTNPSLNVNGIPVIDNSTVQVCPGVAVPLQIINGSDYNWSWTPSTGLSTTIGNSVDATVSTSETYVATGTNSCGSTTSLTITLNPSLTSSIGTVGTITGPTAVCLPSSNQSYSVDPVDNATLYEWTVPSGVSIVGGDGTNRITVSFSSAFNGNVTVKARNGCGVSNTSTLNITGATAITPTVNCPSNITVDATSGQCGTNVNFSASGTGTISYSHAPGSYFPVGTTTVTVTSTTSCGSTACSFNIEVVDNTKPTITAPADVTTVLDLNQTYASGVNLGTPTTGDNCAVDHVTNDAPTTFPLGTTLVTWTVIDVHGNSNTAAQNVVVNKRSTILVYSGDDKEQYSDLQGLTATLTDAATGTPLSDKTINFKIATQPTVSATTNSSGIGSTSQNVWLAPGPYSIASNFAGDGIYLPASDNDNFTVNQEDADVTYTGNTYFTLPSTTATTMNVPVTVLAKDITAMPTNDLRYDSYKGDISKANMMFSIGTATPTTVAVALVNPPDSSTGTANTSYTVALNSTDLSSGGKTIIVYSKTGLNYQNGASGLPQTVTVASPGTGFVTGGGYILNTTPTGLFAPSVNERTNFGFTMQYTKSGSNLKGQCNIIMRSNGKVYQIKSNAINTLSIDATGLKGYFNTKATISDVTDPLNTKSAYDKNGIAIPGGLDLTVWINDVSQGGKGDQVAIQLFNGSQLLYSSNWSGTKTVLQTLSGGNISVRTGTAVAPASSPALLTSTATDINMGSKLALRANPNPSNAYFSLQLISDNTQDGIDLRVMDLLGRTIETRQNLQAGQILQIGSQYRPGAYILEATQGQRRETLKLIKLSE